MLAENSVHCEMDRDAKVGQVKCGLCGEKFTTKIHELSEPIDVYRYVRSQHLTGCWLCTECARLV